ncbi:hypothetical protein GDO81_009520 [Engystomops pustulosus]|uniref:Pentraxin family member n=1 Tax=Engystomops pustulosus TaxID=76066 RepID=A0AAV7BSI9_ENGPU|nr:hypothetical protein GDO81_009520 [Engystomops pustulosus]
MLVLMLMWISGVGGQIDMRGKLLVFTEESLFVLIFPDHEGPFTEGTVCMRFRSDLTRPYSLFSVTTVNTSTFHLYSYLKASNEPLLTVSNHEEYYHFPGKNFSEWTSVCATWRPSVWGLFVNEKKYERENASNVHMDGDHYFFIGDDFFGKGFHEVEPFVGEMTDVNMWDKALTDEDMMDYFADEEMSGNIIDWKALDFRPFGNVSIEDYNDPYPCMAI